MIPAHLGVNLPERLQNWLALRKQGTALIDSSQEGQLQQGATLNTIFNGYDDTIKGQAIQAIQFAMESIEQTCSSITGVFRERLNGIEQRDAVSNIKIGQTNSFIITKQYYHQMDLLMSELLLDCMNLAKSVFKKGLTGSLILGDRYQKIFTALPEHYTVSDYDIRILTTSDINKDIETVRSIIPEFIKSGALQPDIIMEAATSKSLPDMKNKVREALQKANKYTENMQKAQEQIQQLEQQVQQASQELQKAQGQLKQFDQAKLQLEQQKIQKDAEIKMFEAKTERDYRTKLIEEQSKRTAIEEAQIYDGNPYNNKVRQIGGI